MPEEPTAAPLNENLIRHQERTKILAELHKYAEEVRESRKRRSRFPDVNYRREGEQSGIEHCMRLIRKLEQEAK